MANENEIKPWQRAMDPNSDFPQPALTSSSEHQRVSRWMGPAGSGKRMHEVPHLQPQKASLAKGGDAIEGVNRDVGQLLGGASSHRTGEDPSPGPE